MSAEEVSMQAEQKRDRLSPVLDKLQFLPWVKAENMDDCFLFWLPVSAFPVPHDQKVWISSFIDRLSAILAADFDLRSEAFLQYKSIGPEMLSDFLKYRRKCIAIMGMGRRPGTTFPPMPTAEQIATMLKNNEGMDPDTWVADYSYWFTGKDTAEHRRLFLGDGGMTLIFLPTDPATQAPTLPFTPALRKAHPLLRKFDVDGLFQAGFKMDDAFLKKSKVMFGGGLEQEPQFDGLAYILPLLDSGHFFAASGDLRTQWFELFDVYLNESQVDKGLVLAFKKPLESAFVATLESMRNDHLVYRDTSWG